ncbi:MAG: hypothetical protein JXM70_02550 [Pirellulales bacterium]|nr:hypothetical protein [Pirellulales bacterium]
MVENPDVSATTNNTKSRLRQYIIGLVLATLAVVAIYMATTAFYPKTPSQSDPPFPTFQESEILTGRVCSVSRALQKKEPATVDLSPRLTYKFLSSLSPNRIDRHPLKWQVMGTLKFKLRSGKEYVLCLYHTDAGEAAFSVNRTYYRGGSEAKLMGHMREAEELMEEKSSARRETD